MPVKSKAQMRMMQAAAHGAAMKDGPSKEVAQKYIRETPKGAKLPARAKKRGK